MRLYFMRIKPKSGSTKKQKAYLKWMGIAIPKTRARLPQLNKHNRKSLHKPSEAIIMFNRLADREAV